MLSPFPLIVPENRIHERDMGTAEFLRAATGMPRVAKTHLQKVHDLPMFAELWRFIGCALEYPRAEFWTAVLSESQGRSIVTAALSICRRAASHHRITGQCFLPLFIRTGPLLGFKCCREVKSFAWVARITRRGCNQAQFDETIQSIARGSCGALDLLGYATGRDAW